MNFTEKARIMLEQDEGRREWAYDDKTGRRVLADVGNVTIGIGWNLDANPLPEEVIELMLTYSIGQHLESAYKIFPDFEKYEENRQLALLNMIFNLGESRFEGFKKLIAAVESKDWGRASHEAKESYWYKQVGDRGKRVAKMLLTNEFPYDGLA